MLSGVPSFDDRALDWSVLDHSMVYESIKTYLISTSYQYELLAWNMLLKPTDDGVGGPLIGFGLSGGTQKISQPEWRRGEHNSKWGPAIFSSRRERKIIMKTMNALRKSVFLALALSVLSFGCASQTVRFQTLPDKADLYINNAPHGKAPVTTELVADSFMNLHPAHKKYTIVAKMDGYEDKKLVLESPSFCYSNTKPFPETVILRLRRSWPDGYNAELREFEAVARKYRELFLKPTIPEEARRFKAQAEFAIEQKRYAEASNLYADGLRLCPWWPEGHFNRALVLVTRELSDYKEAVTEMKKYIM